MDAILIVEDSRSFASLLKNRVESALPVRALWADSLKQARELMAGEGLLLAILDLHLPDAPQGEIVDEVHAHGLQSIILTATFNKATQARVLRQGVLDYFVKDNIGVIDSVIHAVERIQKNKNTPILVVDDSKSARAAIRRFLEHYGFQVLEAAEGDSALALLGERAIPLVITDYQMPGMNGIDLVRNLRSRHSRDRVAVIGFSSQGEPDLAVRFIKAGANDFLVKPYQPEELLCRVYQNIEGIERRRELEEMAERHRAVLENALDAIITIDREGRTLDFNPAAEKLFGHARGELLGRPLAEFIIPEPLRPRHEEALRHLAVAPQLPVRRRFEFPGIGAEGHMVDLQVALTSLVRHGEPQYTAFIQDITDRKQLLKSLEETLLAAEAANLAKSQFIANMSHEFRTPMNAMLGFTDLALKVAPTRQLADYLQKIKNASHSLMGVINDILDFSKMEAGRLALDPVKFDLNQMLDRLADLFSIQVAEKGIELVFFAPPEFDPVLLGDATRLEQVLINLIRNAVKFTDKGTITVSAEPGAVGEDGRLPLAFAVRDTGIGVKPEILHRLFDPFVQADASTSRKYGGTGLGLSICRNLVQLMDGQIGAESTPGQGSVFSFTVMVRRHADNRRKPWALPHELLGERVLVADDNPACRDSLARLLTVLGVEPVLAASGRETLAVLERGGGLALALVDWELGDKNGIDTVVELCAKAAATGAPMPRMVLMTPFGAEALKESARDAGIDLFLDKPITRAHLVETLRGEYEDAATPRDRRSARVLGEEHDTGMRIAGCRLLLLDDHPVNRQITVELLERVGVVVELAHGVEHLLALAATYPHDGVLMDVPARGADPALAAWITAAPLPILGMSQGLVDGDEDRALARGMKAVLDKPIRPERLYGALQKLLTTGNPPPLPPLPELDDLADLPGMDMTPALQALADNRVLYQRLLVRLLHDHGGDPTRLHELLERGDQAGLKQRAHLLLGLARLLGAVAVATAAAEVEQAVTTANPVELAASVMVLGNRLRQLLAELGHGVAPVPRTLAPVAANAPHAIAPLLDTLAHQLAHHDIEGSSALETMATLVAGGPLAIPCQELIRQTTVYNFQEALEQLQRLAAALGHPLAPTPAPRGNSARVLIVDDQRDNVDLLREVLADFHRLVALDGPQTLRVAGMLPQPDLILLDVMMPGMNGYEVCRRLKENPRTREIPVIFLTAKKEVGDESEGFQAGGVDYITKPFSPEIVRQRVHNQLVLRDHQERLEELVRDRTGELEEAKQEADRRKEAAEAGTRAKSRFLAAMSHEIRTPMNAILGMAEALSETPLTPDQRQFVQVSQRAGQSLLALIDDLLDLSRVEAGKLALEIEAFTLLELLESAVELIAQRAREKGLTLTLDVDPALPARVTGAPQRLRQVVINLLSNAVKFTHRGGIRVQALPAAGGQVRLQVRDTGIGIPVDKREEIFQGFVQADPTVTRSYGGSGLGLAISRHLVTLMGGVIGVESTLGLGSLFHVTLPLPACAPMTSPAPAPPLEPLAVAERAAAILLVEDAEDNVLLVEVFLRKHPYRVTVARDGQEGLEIFQRQRFDLVLMDVQMPRMDGYTATRAMRAFEAAGDLPRTPILALTAHALAEESKNALNAGCDGFLTKPLAKKHLLLALSRVLSGEARGEFIMLDTTLTPERTH